MRDTVVRRTLLAVTNLLGLAAFLWPFVLPQFSVGREPHATDAPVIFGVLLACLGALLFVELGRGGMGPKVVALIGALGAAMVALRLPGFVFGFSAMFIVVLVAGNSFGASFGFLLGAVGTFASGIFVGGLGPWLPFQMVAVGWIGAGAGLIPKPAAWPARIAWLAAYGFVAGFVFGALTNMWFWPFAAGSSEIGWRAGAGAFENLGRYVDFYLLTSLFWDSFRAVGNVILVLVLGRPLLAALDRAARRIHVTVS